MQRERKKNCKSREVCKWIYYCQSANKSPFRQFFPLSWILKHAHKNLSNKFLSHVANRSKFGRGGHRKILVPFLELFWLIESLWDNFQEFFSCPETFPMKFDLIISEKLAAPKSTSLMTLAAKTQNQLTHFDKLNLILLNALTSCMKEICRKSVFFFFLFFSLSCPERIFNKYFSFLNILWCLKQNWHLS